MFIGKGLFMLVNIVKKGKRFALYFAVAAVVFATAFAFSACADGDGSGNEIKSSSSPAASISSNPTGNISQAPTTTETTATAEATATTEATATATNSVETTSNIGENTPTSESTATSKPTPSGTPMPTDGVADRTPVVSVIQTQYVVRGKFADSSSEIGGYDDIEEAKLMADVNAHLGYSVFDRTGNLVYNKYGEKITSIFGYSKEISDYIIENGFKTGEPKKNPAFDSSEKLIDGGSYIGWVLYKSGYINGQSSAKGLKLNKPGSEGNLADFCASQEFTKITDIESVQAGDIVFYGQVDGVDGYAGGASIVASNMFEDDTYYLYDYTTIGDTLEMQPFRGPINDFMFAYRIKV